MGHVGLHRPGDRISIERSGKTIYYKLNGTILYTSKKFTLKPLLVDTSLFSSGTGISNALIFGHTYNDNDYDNLPDNWEIANGLDINNPNDPSHDPDGDQLPNHLEYANRTLAQDPDTDNDQMPDGWEVYHDLAPLDPSDANTDPDADGISNLNEYLQGTLPTHPFVTWTDMVGISYNATNYSLTKTAPTNWDNSGAASLESIAGDGYVEFTMDDYSSLMVGLSSNNDNASYTSIDYAAYPTSDGSVLVYENGVTRGAMNIQYIPGDRFSVERVGTTIYYKKNGATFYTSTISSSGPLIVDTAFYYLNSHISKVRLYGSM